SQFFAETHFVGSNETHAFIKRPRLVRSVQEKPVEFFFARPAEYFFHDKSRGAALPPFRFGEDVEYNRVPAHGEFAVGRRGWMRRYLAQLHPAPGDDQVGLVLWNSEPADVFATRQAAF